jgi:uncharacterized protein (DUF111 family)
MLSKVKFIFIVSALLVLGVQAKYTEEQRRELQNRQPGLTSKGVQRRLMRANELIVQDNRKGAIEILEKMAAKTNYRPFELGKIWQTLAYAYAKSRLKLMRFLISRLFSQSLPWPSYRY